MGTARESMRGARFIAGVSEREGYWSVKESVANIVNPFHFLFLHRCMNSGFSSVFFIVGVHLLQAPAWLNSPGLTN